MGQLRRFEFFAYAFQLCLLLIAAAAGNACLRYFDLVWIGRFLGIPGLLLILLALAYSLRKRRAIRRGNPRTYLKYHEVLSWLGALLVLIHAGTHFNAVLAWLALIAMAINVISGLTGAFLLARSKRQLGMGRPGAPKQSAQDGDTERFAAALTHRLMRKWRVLHIPISIAFAALATGHVVSMLLFWEWR